MEDRKRALDAKDQGSSYSPPKLSIIDSYTLTLGPLDDNVTVDKATMDLMTTLFMWRIAVAPGMDQYTFDLLVDYFIMCYWYQLPNADDKSDVKKVRLSNNIHALNTILRRTDIEPAHPTKLELGPDTPTFRDLHDRIYNGVIYYLVTCLGMDPKDEGHVVISCRRYLAGVGVRFHSDGDKKIGETTFSMRLVIGLGPSRTVNFKLCVYDLANPGSESDRKYVKGVHYALETGNISGSYLMPPDISGKKFFCFLNEDKTFAARAMHEVVPLDPTNNDTGGILVIDFQLRSLEAVQNALVHHKKNVLSLCIPKQK